MDRAPLYARIAEFFDRRAAEAVGVAADLYAHPELSGAEHRSAAKLADLAVAAGFEVELPYGGLPTAFRAVKECGAAGATARAAAGTTAGATASATARAAAGATASAGAGDETRSAARETPRETARETPRETARSATGEGTRRATGEDTHGAAAEDARGAVDGRAAGPTVAFLAEYDALPEIGHGCGHNFIGTVGTFAALAAGSVADALPAGARVVLVGTPAEETTGGKIDLLRAGAFEGIDAAMMVHPSTETTARVRSLALVQLDVRFRGRAAHAAATPWEGANALDAMIQFFVALSLLKKQLTPDVRIPGIITNGGNRANIVPDLTEASFTVRTAERARLDGVLAKFRACAEAAALATGCTAEVVEVGNRYDDFAGNEALGEAFERHFAAVGGEIAGESNGMIGSLDIGNLSHRFPCIHPRVATAAPGTSLHTRAFGDSTLTPFGREQMRRAAEAMARTAVDFLVDAAFRARVEATFAGG